MKAPETCGSLAGGGFMCCGLDEFDGLNTPAKYFSPAGVIRQIVESCNIISTAGGNDNCADGASHIIFTQMYGRGTGAKLGCANINALAAYIEKHNLGAFVFAPVRVNPNSGNKIKPAIFAPNSAALVKWAKERGIVEDDYSRRYEERQEWASRSYY